MYSWSLMLCKFSVNFNWIKWVNPVQLYCNPIVDSKQWRGIALHSFFDRFLAVDYNEPYVSLNISFSEKFLNINISTKCKEDTMTFSYLIGIFSQFSWQIIDIHHCLYLRYTAWWFDIRILWNYNHNRLS